MGLSDVASFFKMKSFIQDIPTQHLTNGNESRSFLKTALAWKGSVAPRIMPRMIWASLYSVAVLGVCELFPDLGLDIAPFEYSGAVLGLLLVTRMNAGVSRWWEARKIWGSVVNQSRNLAIMGYEYSGSKKSLMKEYLHWLALWPYTMKALLREEDAVPEGARLLSKEEMDNLRRAPHKPFYIGAKIASLLKKMREDGLDGFAFQQLEKERALLIDAIGACERIKSTPIPLVLAIKTRRFILLFLTLLPFALYDKVDVITPFIMMLTAYPLFCLDEIGVELQNPFAKENLSHLPLNALCQKIEATVLSIEDI